MFYQIRSVGRLQTAWLWYTQPTDGSEIRVVPNLNLIPHVHDHPRRDDRSSPHSHELLVGHAHNPPGRGIGGASVDARIEEVARPEGLDEDDSEGHIVPHTAVLLLETNGVRVPHRQRLDALALHDGGRELDRVDPLIDLGIIVPSGQDLVELVLQLALVGVVLGQLRRIKTVDVVQHASDPEGTDEGEEREDSDEDESEVFH